MRSRKILLADNRPSRQWRHFWKTSRADKPQHKIQRYDGETLGAVNSIDLQINKLSKAFDP